MPAIAPDITVAVPTADHTDACQNFEPNRPQSLGIVVHATRSGAAGNPLEQEFAGTVNYMLNPASQVSSHFVVGPSGVARMVHDGDKAWHATYLNPTHLGIELAQPVGGTPFTDFQYDAAARVCAGWCAKFGIPVVHAAVETQGGIIGHQETAQGRSYGKTDPGASFDWGRFMALVAGYAGVATPTLGPIAPVPGYWPNGRPIASNDEYESHVWAPVYGACKALLNGGNGALGDDASAQGLLTWLGDNKHQHGAQLLFGRLVMDGQSA